jgi:hypothetical protein
MRWRPCRAIGRLYNCIICPLCNTNVTGQIRITCWYFHLHHPLKLAPKQFSGSILLGEDFVVLVP